MSMLTRLAATGVAPAVYVDDVFSTFLYTGTGSAQTITNGIDLSGKGGMVWQKSRTSSGFAGDHTIYDTVRGPLSGLLPNLTDAAANLGTSVTLNSTGFVAGNGSSRFNQSGQNMASWTFRKQPKFFDVVTYTGTGSSLTVSHSLGAPAGILFIKRIDASGGWVTQHISTTTSVYFLNTTAANANGNAYFAGTAMSSTNFTVGGLEPEVNANGASYVAYLFAHDTSASGLIRCGSYTGNGSATGPTVTLGWEPQWLMIKRATGGTGNWNIFDNMRGMTVGGDDWYLEANTSDAEASANWVTPTATGFQIDSTSTEVNNNTDTYIYVAIRRSNKPPTAGTQVFQPTVYTGTNVDNRLVDTTIAPDMVWVRQRDDTVLGGMVVGDRLRGQPYLLTGTTDAEVNDADALDQQIVSATEYGTAFSAMNGFYCGNDATAKLNASTTASNQIAEAFKRAAGFFDVVCYTGTGANTTVSHSLGVVPELMIVKSRSAASTNWSVYAGTATQFLVLNSTAIPSTNSTFWNNTSPTSSVFSLGTSSDVNNNTTAYVAYLFATLAGISKVGTYTGNGGTAGTNGTSQTINCGFTAGARFVLIKRRDSTGDWYVFDSARGIVAAADPYLLTNSTAAEVTTVDAVDADNSGFIVNQTSGTNLNVTSATYIYLAIA